MLWHGLCFYLVVRPEKPHRIANNFPGVRFLERRDATSPARGFFLWLESTQVNTDTSILPLRRSRLRPTAPE
jgi:hypothetical protein